MNMRNITPMILVALMLASIFASIDFVELEETVVIEETGARSGADAEAIAITSPKETSCNNNGCRNELKVGETTTFAAFIKNSGDAAIEEMGYAVTVYSNDGSGNAAAVVLDANGDELSWENGNVICDDILACPISSLAAGAILGGGKTTLQTEAGTDIQWTPVAGFYVIEVVVNAIGDVDPGNDVQQIIVNVVDWVDIAVDLSWDGQESDLMTGEGTKAFTLTVTSNGSASNGFNPRNVTVLLDISGDLTQALSSTGEDLWDNGGISTLVASTTSRMEETFRHGEDPNNVTNDTRDVLVYQTVWTYQGSIMPNDAITNGTYSLEASLVSFVDYDAWESCWERFSENNSEGETTETVWYHMCEETQNSDDYPSSNSDTIAGAISNYHDIRITTLTIFQGYDSTGGGEPTFSVSDGQSGDLNVGVSRIHVQVEHRGSNEMTTYDWEVTFTITKEGESNSPTNTVNSCAEIEPAYMHAELGMNASAIPPASLTGFACDLIVLEEGTYTFEADLAMVNPKSADQRPSNNHKSMTLDVVNNLPMITSFDLNTLGDLVVGQEEFLQMSVQAFDVDDPSGESLEYSWNYQGGVLPGCGGLAGAGMLCQFPIVTEYVMIFAVTVTVTDSQGASVSEEMMLEIWNNGVGAATTDSGIQVQYPIQYWAASDFSITASDGDLNSFIDQELPGYTGTYDAIAVVEYAPENGLSANDVLSQSMLVIFDKSLGATSLWYVTDAGLWTSMSTTVEDVDGTTSMFNFDFPADSATLPAGSLVLIGAALEEAVAPVASISAFDASAGKGGALVMNWNVSTILLSSDTEVVTITCDTSDAACKPLTTNAVPGAKTYTYSGANTVHGMSYNVSVAICNAAGCSTPIGTGTIIADKAVDGGVSAMNMAVQAVGEEWTVSWAATGETFDVDHWNVCYQKQDSFDAANMPSQCVSTAGATDTTINIAMPTAEGTWDYYFTAVPVDGLGNSASDASMNSIEYHRDKTIENPDDGNPLGVDGSTDGVPGFVWGIIGGLILVAVIVSAVILRRGDGDGEENKDWDY
jgi:archaellum component FlaG (FlaF/FlaG flagellin family)